MESSSNILSVLAGIPAIVGLVLTAVSIFLTSDWRLSLTALLVQYLFIGVTLIRFLAVEVIVVKILAGVLAVFILYLTARRLQEEKGSEPSAAQSSRFLGLSVAWRAGPLGLPLRLLAVVLVVLGLVRLFSGYRFPVVSADLAFVAFWMGSMGILGIILSGDPLRVAAAVLSILSGFDLVYASLAPSLAIVGFWSALTLIAALGFSYLAMVQALGTEQSEAGHEELEL